MVAPGQRYNCEARDSPAFDVNGNINDDGERAVQLTNSEAQELFSIL